MEAEQYIIPSPRQALEMRRVPLDALEPRSVRVKVAYAGLCHTDLHLCSGGYDVGKGEWLSFENRPGYKYPIVPGHEISGHVCEVGRDVKTEDGLAVGDAVAVFPFIGCGECPQCLHHRDNFCERPLQRGIGFQRSGGFSTHVTVPDPRFLIKVPTGVDLKTASMVTCSGLTAFSALGEARDALALSSRVRGHARMLVVGCGGLGQWAMRLAPTVVASLATVAGDEVKLDMYAADLRLDQLDIAKQCGAKGVVQWTNDMGVEDVEQRTVSVCGDKVDVILDFVGSSKTVSNSLQVLQQGGLLVIVGLFGGTFEHPLPYIPLRCHRIVGVHTGSPAALRELLTVVAERKIDSPPTELFEWMDVNKAFQKLSSGQLSGRGVVAVAQAE